MWRRPTPRISWIDAVAPVERKSIMHIISVTVDLPGDAEQRLRAESPDFSTAVREGFVVNLFRRGILSHYELGQALGLDRFETDALLNRHRLTEQSPTHEEVDAEVKCLKDFLDRDRP
jgi:hypothetical protein